MKQHYLPRFYLDGFTDPEAERSPARWAWVYTSRDRKWRRRAPKNLATKTDLYSVMGEGGKRNDELERVLSLVEGLAANVIRARMPKQEPLQEEARDAMAYFLALMSNRLPAFLDNWSRFIIRVEEHRMQLLRSHPEAFAALKRRYQRETGKKLPDWFGPEHLDPKRYKIVPSKGFILSRALAPINEMAYVLADMSWAVFTTGANEPFITSDYPLCAVSPGLQGTPYGPGLLQRDVQVTFPLGSGLALLVTWVGSPITYFRAKPQDVEEINLRTMSAATEFIVSPRRDFPGSDKLGDWARRPAGPAEDGA